MKDLIYEIFYNQFYNCEVYVDVYSDIPASIRHNVENEIVESQLKANLKNLLQYIFTGQLEKCNIPPDLNLGWWFSKTGSDLPAYIRSMIESSEKYNQYFNS